jgi:hypothetical protein
VKFGKARCTIAATLGGMLLLLAAVQPALSAMGIVLYEDPNTGALYRKPGKGRVRVTLGAEPIEPEQTQEIEHQVEHRVEQKAQEQIKLNSDALRAEFMANQATLLQENATLQARVNEIEPAWRGYIDGFRDKFRVGTLIYGDWRIYSHTGWGPQELTQINTPGPGNNGFNSFDINRAYMNFYFYPTDDFTARVTPNLYRINAGGISADTFGKTSQAPATANENLGVRIKYAFLQYNKPMEWNDYLRGATITFGVQPNPLVAWEEDLYGFRYVNLTPWNYASLSSSQTGISMQGPLKFNEKTYLDYDFGAYTNASFHAEEQGNTKQVMGRLTAYPLGARWRFDGLGATFFYDYGYGNTAADVNTAGGFGNGATAQSGTAFGTASKAHIARLATLLHYDSDNWGLAAEYDYGHNAFTGSNLFSSTGPTQFFTPTKLTSTSGSSTPYQFFAAEVAALQNNSRTVQSMWDVFGHYHIPDSPLTAFGMFQWMQPNTKVNLNPLDFQRWVAGLQYQYNEFVRISLDSQNLMYYHGQFPESTEYLSSFAPLFPRTKVSPGHFIYTPATFGGNTLASAKFGQPVPRDEHAFFINLEFSY